MFVLRGPWGHNCDLEPGLLRQQQGALERSEKVTEQGPVRTNHRILVNDLLQQSMEKQDKAKKYFRMNLKMRILMRDRYNFLGIHRHGLNESKRKTILIANTFLCVLFRVH